MTRDEWLKAVVDHFRPEFEADGKGFPTQGARGTAIGECYPSVWTTDGVPHVFIKPTFEPKDSAVIIATIVHELAHVALDGPVESPHGKEFAALAAAVGLERPWKATTAGAGLESAIGRFLDKHGPIPNHGAVVPQFKKKQTTRMRKCMCGACGYTVRLTAKWLDELGPPICPGRFDAGASHGTMEGDEEWESEAEAEEGEEE